MSRNALVVGINAYQSLPALRTPSEDAEAIAQLLEQYGNFHVTRLHAVKSETNPNGKMSRKLPVSQADLESQLLNLFKPEGRNVPDTALLFFSGHGLRRDRQVYQEGYLAVSETDQVEKWGVSMEWLRRLLEKSPVRQQIIWLDCCHAGELLNFEEANPGAKGDVRDRFFIAASREYESAYEETGGKHGLLTAALLEALDPQRQNGEATNHSVCAHIQHRFRSTIQQPVFSNFGGSISLTFPPSIASAAPVAAVSGPDECPFKGLDYFDFRGSDPDYFFGRDALTDALLDMVREKNFLAVLGPSGSGKSSVVRAGLIHTLSTGRRLSGSEAWPVLAMKPVTGERGGGITGFSDDPLENLARAFVSPDKPDTERALELRQARVLVKDGGEGLADLIRVKAGTGRLILLIDQFEECFTLVQDPEKRAAFFRCLLDALPLLEQQVCLILTMRADFLGKCAEAEYAGLADAVRKHMMVVTPMTDDDIRAAIRKPAEKAGLEAEDELVEAMVAEVADSPASLPLLQYTLTELFRQREGHRLTLAAYTRMRGVKGALARRADEIFNGFSSEEQSIARRIFIALTHLGEGSEDTRRQVPLHRLITSADAAESVERVIARLADARLVVTGEVQARGEEDERVPVVDVAHEALIRHWPLLRSWLDEDRDAIRFERRLDGAVDHWIENGKHRNLLWRSPDLDLLETFRAKRGEGMTLEQRYFLKDGLAARKAEQWRKKLIWSLAAAALLLFAGFGWKYAENQKRLTREAAKERDRANSLLAKKYWTSALNAKKQGNLIEVLHFMALSARQTKNNATITNAKFDIQSVHLQPLINYISSNTDGALFNDDGTRVLTWTDDGTARLWNGESGESIGQPMKYESRIKGAVFTKNEIRVLIWSNDGTARLWNGETGAPVGQPMKHERGIYGAVFTKDEKRILTWCDKFRKKGGSAHLWNGETGAPIGQTMKHEGDVNGARFSKSETLILTWSDDGTARLWNSETGGPIGQPMKHEKRVNGAVFSKDETRILTWSGDLSTLGGIAHLWNGETGAPVGQPMGHELRVNGAVFSKDETRILTWSNDGTARLWNGETGAPVGQPMKHGSRVFGAVFSKDETRILSWSYDGGARLWNGETGTPVEKLVKHKYLRGALFSKDETRILTWSDGNTARLWKGETGAPIGQPMKHDQRINGALFSEDETQILTWSNDGTARLWYGETTEPASQPMNHEDSVHYALFKSRILTWGDKITARLWNGETEAPLGKRIKHKHVRGGLFKKDGTRILTWSDDGTARLWDSKTGEPVSKPMAHDKNILGALFSKDETRILTWSDDGTARLWNGETGAPIGQAMKTDREPVGQLMPLKKNTSGALFSDDETRVLTWNGGLSIRSGLIFGDGTSRLWDAETGAPIGKPMKHKAIVVGTLFNKAKDRILTWTMYGGTFRFWDVGTGAPLGQPVKHGKIINGAFLTKDKSQVLTWSDDGTARLWNGETGAPLGHPMKHERDIYGAVFNKDETRILTWSADGAARLWNGETGAPVGQPMKHESIVNGAMFSKDEAHILTWSLDQDARLWDGETGAPLGQPMKHDGDIYGAVFNKDETRILTWSADGAARLWNGETGSPVGQPMKHESGVNGALFSKDETRILTWSDDGSARLWNGQTGDPVGQPMKHESIVNGAVFSKDETRILTWSDDGTAHLWNIGADYDFPKQHLPLLVEVATGTQMDDYGNVTVLSKKDWEAKRDEYIQIAEEHLKTCQHKKYNLYNTKQREFWKERRAELGYKE